MAHAHERPLLGERLHDLDRRRLLGRSQRHPPVLPRVALGVREDPAYDLTGLDGPELVGGEGRAIGCVGREPDDAEEALRGP